MSPSSVYTPRQGHFFHICLSRRWGHPNLLGVHCSSRSGQTNRWFVDTSPLGTISHRIRNKVQLWPTRTAIPIKDNSPPGPLQTSKTTHQDQYLYGGALSWWGVVRIRVCSSQQSQAVGPSLYPHFCTRTLQRPVSAIERGPDGPCLPGTRWERMIP